MNSTVQPLVSSRSPGLLGAEDPPPFEVIHAADKALFLLVCDHASHAVPAVLAGLGLDQTILRRHIGWDIGAADVTRRLARLLDAPAVLAGFSRLVIDCNRLPGAEDSILAVSDGVVVPGNAAVDDAAAKMRAEACYTPYHEAIEERLDAMAKPAVIAVHSFTPQFNGFERPWQVGILWDHDDRLARPLMDALATDPKIHVGDNEPYSGRKVTAFSTPRHAEVRGCPYVTVEIRQDLIDTRRGAEAWAHRMAAALRAAL